jgi:pyrroloquinoline quinone (PQQ) biosynthesis protein C
VEKAKGLVPELVDVVAETYLRYPNRWFDLRRAQAFTLQDLRVYLKQFAFVARNFPRWLANVTANCPVLEVRQQLIRNMWDEDVKDSEFGDCHYNFLLRFGRAVGLKDEEIHGAEPFPTTFAAIMSWDHISRTRSWVEGLAMAGGLELINTEEIRKRINLPRVKQAYAKLGLNPEDYLFNALHEVKDEEHGNLNLAVVERFATTEERKQQCKIAARDAAMLFSMLLEGIYCGARGK